jgi:phosphoribosylformylglycinamidine synthase
MRNDTQSFTALDQPLRVESTATAWTRAYQPGQRLVLTIKNGEGNYQADAETLARLEDSGRVVVRYLGNPNGSVHDIAGVANERGNVVGLMPHPEHNVDPVIAATGHGRGFFESLAAHLGL